jgi:hypothetical protein
MKKKRKASGRPLQSNVFDDLLSLEATPSEVKLALSQASRQTLIRALVYHRKNHELLFPVSRAVGQSLEKARTAMEEAFERLGAAMDDVERAADWEP